MPLDSIVERTPGPPATRASIAADLAKLGVESGSLVLVHSSLSSLGWVCGGAVTVVDALIDAVGSSGTLVMPAHTTDLTEPEHWENPPVPESWWPVIREAMPAFDPKTTPGRYMGAICEYFRTLPDVVRSSHPQHSFAARGPLAHAVTDSHQLDQSLGDPSPLGQVYSLQGLILLLGVGHDRNTSLHLSESRAFEKDKKLRKGGAPVLVNGSREWVSFMESDYGDNDFIALGKALEKETEIVTHGRVAQADARLMPHVGLVDYGVDWLRANSDRET